MDHLTGHLFIEKLSILKRKKFERDWKKRDKDKNSFISLLFIIKKPFLIYLQSL